MRGERDRNLERAWRERIRTQAASRLSIRAFCGREGVAESAFYFWRRELVRRDAEPRDAAISKSSADNGRARFVPIAIAEPNESLSKSSPSVSTGGMELVHPGGVVLRVTGGFDAVMLRHVLDLLDARETNSTAPIGEVRAC